MRHMILLCLAWSFSTVVQASPARSELSIGNFLQVTPNIYRGGRPAASDILDLVQQYGIKTDIDLEDESSAISAERGYAKTAKMQFLLTEIDPYSTPTDAEVNSVLAQMQDASNFPIFVHCHYGDDRTGLIVALYRVEVQAWTPAAAYAEMIKDGFHTTLTALDNYFRQRTGYTGN